MWVGGCVYACARAHVRACVCACGTHSTHRYRRRHLRRIRHRRWRTPTAHRRTPTARPSADRCESRAAVQPPQPVSEPQQVAPPPINQNIVEKILPGRKEVFNIAQNKYTYSDSEPLCKAFGAELASYDQVKDAWQKGADWCNYGWVKGQAAVFPTQESTFNKLQSGPDDQRLSCGVAGINGGYFDNPELRFGVNCYGVRPSENEADNREIMNKNNLTPDAIAFDKKVFNYKSHKSEIPVNPFSSDNWSS